MVSKESLRSEAPPRVGVLTGPTATGKSSLALELAAGFGNIEIVNADSLLVYRGMNIGTAKPTEKELQQVPHHLIDIRNPDEPFTAGEFLRAATAAIEEIHQRGRRALVVGGTGFYLKALLYGIWPAPSGNPELREKLQALGAEELFRQLSEIDPTSATRIGKSDPYRLIRAMELFHLSGKSPTELQALLPTEANPQFELWILNRPDSELHLRIQLRTQQMLEAGLIEEFQKLSSQYPLSRALNSVGYAQVKTYLSGEPPPGRKIKPGLEGLSEEIQLATRQLVKRQRTWFRGQFKTEEESVDRLEEDFKKVYL